MSEMNVFTHQHQLPLREKNKIVRIKSSPKYLDEQVPIHDMFLLAFCPNIGMDPRKTAKCADNHDSLLPLNTTTSLRKVMSYLKLEHVWKKFHILCIFLLKTV